MPASAALTRASSQRGCVDVGHQHARFRRVLGDEDTARPGAAADIDGVSDGCGSLLQASFDRARKAVCVGAEKHRIRVFCRKGGMEEQLSCKRGHANAAAQNRVLFNENARFSHEHQDFRGNYIFRKAPAPAEHVAQVFRPRVFFSRIHARMRCRRYRREFIACCAQRVAEPQQRAICIAQIWLNFDTRTHTLSRHEHH